MRVDDVEVEADQAFDDVGWKFDHVGVEPQYPIMIAEGTEQEMITGFDEDGPPGRLDDGGVARRPRGQAQAEILLEQAARAKGWTTPGQRVFQRRIGVIAASPSRIASDRRSCG